MDSVIGSVLRHKRKRHVPRTARAAWEFRFKNKAYRKMLGQNQASRKVEMIWNLKLEFFGILN